MKYQLLSTILIILFFTACAANPAPPEPAAQPTEVVSQPQPTVAPTDTPIPPPTATPVVAPTNTATSVVVPTNTATPVGPATPEATATEEVAPETMAAADLTFEIVNVSDSDICDIAITPSQAAELGENLVNEPLGLDEALIFTDFGPGLYDLYAADCSADELIVDEVFGVELSEASLVWFISDGVELADNLEPREEAAAQDEVASSEQETTTLPASSAQYRQADCPIDTSGFTVDCGYLTVPENRKTPTGNTIELAVAILRANSNNIQPDPLVYLAGGPGGSALSDFEAEPDAWADYPFSRDRDFIFIDQRGTGYSSPTLNCPEIEFADNAANNPDLACRDRLVAEGIDLTAYNTAENAADVAALMQTLGYDSWNLIGISYGTRLGLAIMRDHPQGIRSVVLDSPFPPNAETPEEEAVYTYDAFQTLFRDCANDPFCNEAFPNLEAVFLDTVTRLNREDGEVFGDDLVAVMEQAINAGPDFIFLLPLMIYEAAEGNFEVYDELAAELGVGGAAFTHFQGGEDRTDSEGMYNSVICHDEFVFSEYDEAERRAVAELPEELLPALFGGTETQFDLCADWGAGAADPKENQAVHSDIPTLVMIGEYDPATPLPWGRLTVETLSNGYLFEFRGAGHSLLSGIECAIQATTEFINNPTVEPDRTCTNNMPGPEFATE